LKHAGQRGFVAGIDCPFRCVPSNGPFDPPYHRGLRGHPFPADLPPWNLPRFEQIINGVGGNREQCGYLVHVKNLATPKGRLARFATMAAVLFWHLFAFDLSLKSQLMYSPKYRMSTKN
jgi:hypothetical protein